MAIGHIGIYERDGVYQLYTDMLIEEGIGSLMQAYEKLKSKLEAEGLFAAERKKRSRLTPGRWVSLLPLQGRQCGM